MPARPTKFDPSIYPRRYGIAIGWRLFLLSFGAVALVGGLAGAVAARTGYGPADATAALGVSLLSIGVALLGLYCIVDTLKSKVTLYPDAIELVDLRRARRMLRSEIKGFSVVRGGNGPGTLVLVPKSSDLKRLRLPQIVQRDEAFRAWFAGLPDLDEVERGQSLAALAADLELGPTEAERFRRLSRGRKISATLHVAAFAIAGWAFFDPRPYGVAVALLAAVPWLVLAIVATSRGLFRLNAKRNEAYPNLAAPFFLPGAVLTMRAFFDFKLIGWQLPLGAALSGGILMAALGAAADRSVRRMPWSAVALALLMSGYGFGAAIEANALLDRSEPQIHRGFIVDKQVHTGKQTTWSLRLRPWGPYLDPSEVNVPRALYDALQLGDVVCIYLRPGALTVPWYVLGQCR